MATTTNHQQIRQWAEARKGVPAIVQGTEGSKQFEQLKIYFPELRKEPENFQQITWEEFFGKFDQNQLALDYPETQDGEDLNLQYNLVNRRNTGPATL